MPQKGRPFRVGKVKVYQRGKVWYLCYHEHGKRKRPRVGRDKVVARKVAAEINAQLEMGAPSILSFERVPIPELRERWLMYHDKVKRTSLHTIRGYRAATEHLLRFVGGRLASPVSPVDLPSPGSAISAEAQVLGGPADASIYTTCVPRNFPRDHSRPATTFTAKTPSAPGGGRS